MEARWYCASSCSVRRSLFFSPPSERSRRVRAKAARLARAATFLEFTRSPLSPSGESTTFLPPYLAARPWPPPAMSAPGPAFFEQIERDERERRRADARNAHAFCARRFVPLFREDAEKEGAFSETEDASVANGRLRARFVVDVRRSNLDNWSVGEVICDHAERMGATAIVMAPHSRGRLREWFVGSACRHCLRRSKTPLVIVRPDYARVRAKQEPEAERGEPHASLVSSAR